MQDPEGLHNIHMLSAIIFPCLKFNFFHFAILASLLISGRWPGLGGGGGGIIGLKIYGIKVTRSQVAVTKELCSIED